MLTAIVVIGCSVAGALAIEEGFGIFLLTVGVCGLVGWFL